MFKVVADQLKISEGWVRCGHCADVFDATLNLQPWTAPSSEDDAPSPSEQAPAPTPTPALAEEAPEQVFSDTPAHGVEPLAEVPTTAPEAEVPQDAMLPLETEPVEAVAVEAVSEPVPEFEPDALPPSWPSEPVPGPKDADPQQPPPQPEPAHEADRDEAESDFHSELARFAAGLGRMNAAHAAARLGDAQDAPSGLPAAPQVLVDGAASVPEAPAPDEPERAGEGNDKGDAAVRIQSDDAADSVQSDDPLPEPGFVRQARRQAYWRKPGVRVALSFVALLLLVLLTAQWAVHDRDRIAASRPGLQPLLQQACAHLGCRLAPVRRIDAIVIDSASLVNRLGDFYSFDLVLKNTASLALAVPALELSLTDIGGAVIARRVFLPNEWPDAPAVLPANGSVTVNFRLALAVGESTPMAGYNALVFYP